MRWVFGFILFSIIALATLTVATPTGGAPELLIFLNKENKQLVFKQYPAGDTDTVISSKNGNYSYAVSAFADGSALETKMKAVGVRDSFKDDGIKVKRYTYNFKSLTYGSKKVKMGWDYELVGRFEGSTIYQRYKVGGVTQMMIRYEADTDQSFIYRRFYDGMALEKTVDGYVTLNLKTFQGTLVPFTDTDE